MPQRAGRHRARRRRCRPPRPAAPPRGRPPPACRRPSLRASPGRRSRCGWGRRRRRRRCRSARARRAARCLATRHSDSGAAAYRAAGRCRSPASLAAVRARRQPERALGGDVQCIGPQRIEPTREFGTRPPRELDLAIAGARETAERRWLDHRDLMAALSEPIDQLGQRGDDAVDLRMPRIGDQRQLHAVAGTAASVAAACCPARTCAAQSMISSRPSGCSTSAVRLSTQSPSLA